MEHRVEFSFSTTGPALSLGRGILRLYHGNRVTYEVQARTGSVNTSGVLVNAIHPDTWFICTPSVRTEEEGMVIDRIGWKVRLYQQDSKSTYRFTHYLIHPDGGKGGTRGCIGTSGPALEFPMLIDEILQTQLEKIPVHIRLEVPT